MNVQDVKIERPLKPFAISFSPINVGSLVKFKFVKFSYKWDSKFSFLGKILGYLGRWLLYFEMLEDQLEKSKQCQ